MRGIRRLTSEVANRIAAGEVVERPASLAKELVENALDAGAKRIDVEFDGGGVDRLRVADDGSGIAAEEVELAFERHATSKLQTAEDLESIGTLGFRGEALASIAAVSRVEMVTREGQAPHGIRVQLEGGEVRSREAAARAPGTTIEVHSLFYNTPARRKFLKTPATESRVLTRLVGQLALGAPGVAFRVVREGKVVLELATAASFRERVGALLVREVAAKMLVVQGERDGISVQGLVSFVDFTRTRSDHQILLVNGRVVVDASIAHAVSAGIGGALPGGKYPIFALQLTLAPDRLDVNVHPTKREVRFRERDRVFGAVREAVMASMQQARFDEAGRTLAFSRREGRSVPRPAGIRFGLPEDVSPAVGLPHVRVKETTRQLPFVPVDTQEMLAEAENVEVADREEIPIDPLDLPEHDEPSSVQEPEPELGRRRLRYVGEIWGSYLLVEDHDRFLIIDQHAAHERILYDEVRARGRLGEPFAAQGLLVPLTVDLGPGEDPEEAARLLQQLGFEAREGGPGTILVDAIPGTLSRWGGGDFLREFFASPESARLSAEKFQDGLAKMYSCRSAVKFGQRLHPSEVDHLLKALSRTEVPRLCPHGRPIYLELARTSIDAKFER